MGTPWDPGTYDRSSEPQQAWASEVLARLEGIAQDATVLEVGCATDRDPEDVDMYDAFREIQRRGTLRIEGWPGGMGLPQSIGL
jgi:hypothetical protein